MSAFSDLQSQQSQQSSFTSFTSNTSASSDRLSSMFCKIVCSVSVSYILLGESQDCRVKYLWSVDHSSRNSIRTCGVLHH